MTTFPPVSIPRLEFWCRRNGRRAARAFEDTLLGWDGDGAGLALRVSDDVLVVSADLNGLLRGDQVEGARDVVEALAAREPTPVLTARVTQPEAADQPGTAQEPAPGEPGTVELSVIVELATSIPRGMTDTQLNAWLAWATALVEATCTDLMAALPLTRPQEES